MVNCSLKSYVEEIIKPRIDFDEHIHSNVSVKYFLWNSKAVLYRDDHIWPKPKTTKAKLPIAYKSISKFETILTLNRIFVQFFAYSRH